MTLIEFKAWFDGFSEGIAEVPTASQWAKVKAKMAEINDTPITYPVFVDRYVQPYRRWFDTYGPAWASADGTSMSVGVAHVVDQGSLAKFDSREAMYVAGRAEAHSLSA